MLANLKTIPAYFLRPLHILRAYRRSNLQPDVVAGLTVAVILLPQGIAYALIAELPPQAGLYTAIVAAIVGALWGSSNHLQTGPTNAASLLVLSIVLVVAAPGSPEFMATAGLMAVMVGLFRLVMGLARLGMLVNFVSDSVIVGFTAGAGVLISVNQLRPLLRLDFPTSSELGEIAQNVVSHLPETHWPSLALGLGTIALIVLLRRLNSKWPGPLIGMMCAAVVVGLVGLEQQGVKVIGQLPRGLPPLAQLPLFDLERIGQLSTGALAIAAIGLVEAMSIARSIASQTGQRLDNNQEFVGQG
ncbi:MAG: SulP family inorganic anion transporter, partial [Longimicrobiales bacterium]